MTVVVAALHVAGEKRAPMTAVVGDGARRALHDRGGAVCRFLRSGRIVVGDTVEGVPAD